MSDFLSIVPGGLDVVGSKNRVDAMGLHSNGRAKAGRMIEVTGERIFDRVEISQGARRMDFFDRLSEHRNERVSEIRRAIDNGTYESDEKIDRAIARLVDDL